MGTNKQWKRVPFDIELVKKIQSGEVEGRVVNVTTEEISYTKYGSTLVDTHKDTFIELPEETSKHEFKPFDKVLVRDYDDCKWSVNFYSHFSDGIHRCVSSCGWKQCIPYEGNEHLVGTTKNIE